MAKQTSKSKIQRTAVKYLKDEYASKRGRLHVIASETGLKVEWLQKVRRGEIKEPSAEKLENLLRYAGFDVQVIKNQVA